jgi:hypothetical protein
MLLKKLCKKRDRKFYCAGQPFVPISSGLRNLSIHHGKCFAKVSQNLSFRFCWIRAAYVAVIWRLLAAQFLCPRLVRAGNVLHLLPESARFGESDQLHAEDGGERLHFACRSHARSEMELQANARRLRINPAAEGTSAWHRNRRSHPESNYEAHDKDERDLKAN